jgi:3-hydroxyisobutyrate dehydrogenase-like beta-hydroxyacid dehydrogenase
MPNAIKTVGLLSPGDMGHSIGGVLRDNGIEVLTCLAERSERTRALAAKSGFGDTSCLEELVEKADAILSVLVPAEAPGLAEQVAGAIRTAGKTDLLYVDLNAIAPETVRGVGQTILATGARFADAGIIGPPPRQPGTRFYTSGPGAEEFATFSEHGLDVRVIGEEIGQASGLKMCYGALTKGLTALGTELLVAARRLGLDEVLRAEQEESIPDVLAWLQQMVPTMPPKAYRWVGEMEEIAKTFEDVGMTPNILTGAADMYRFIADTPIGQESPENRDKRRGLDGVVAALADALAAPAPAD